MCENGIYSLPECIYWAVLVLKRSEAFGQVTYLRLNISTSFTPQHTIVLKAHLVLVGSILSCQASQCHGTPLSSIYATVKENEHEGRTRSIDWAMNASSYVFCR